MAVSLYRVMKESRKLLKKCNDDYINKETSLNVKLEEMGEVINHVKEKVDKLEVETTETKADFCSYKDALMKNVQSLSTENTAINEQKITSTIDKAFVINQRDRSRNVIIYGLEEHENDDRDEVTLVKNEVIDYICEDLHESDIVQAVRIGERKDGSIRPLRVTFWTKSKALEVVKKSGNLHSARYAYIGDLTLGELKNLKRHYNYYDKIFVCPDLSYKERMKKRSLVIELKKKISEEPEKHWSIRGHMIVSKRLRSTDPDRPWSDD